MLDLQRLVRSLDECGSQTVPDALIGCWQRNWIRFGDDAEPENHVRVIWVQTASGMGDLRIDPTLPPDRTDSSCGLTMVDEATAPYPTANWVDGETGFAQQAVPSFPEPGWLAFDRQHIMRELAPSGAYVEQWQKLPGSVGVAAHLVAPDASTTTNLYVAGDHVFFAARRHADALLHDFSYGRLDLDGEAVTIELSTRAERVGHPMALEFEWRPVSCRHVHHGDPH